MRARCLVGLLLLVSITATCQPDRPPVAKPGPILELRGADGQVALALLSESDGLHWMSPTGDGRLREASLPAGGRALHIEGAEGPLTAVVDGAGLRIEAAGLARVTITRVDGRLRVGDGQGFPRARVSEQGERAQLHDAAGMLRAEARAEGGRIVVTDRDGRVLGYVVGLDDPSRAAALFLPGLGEGERVLLLAPGLTWP